MAEGASIPPILRIRRSAQSGNKAMTVAWQVVYTENCTQVYIFAGAIIDLNNMAAGDNVDIRIRKIIIPTGAWVMVDQMNYINAQPVNHPTCQISGIPDVSGVEISIRQTAGVLRTFATEFYDAKRLGLL